MKNAQQTSNDAVLAVLRAEMETFFEGMETEMLQQAKKGFHNIRFCISKALWFELSETGSDLWCEFNRRLNKELGMEKYLMEHAGQTLDSYFDLFELDSVAGTQYLIIKLKK